MKQLIVLLGLSVFCITRSFSQCDKPVLFTSTSSRIISNGIIGNTAAHKTSIKIGKGTILFTSTIDGIQGVEKYTITATPLCNWSGYLQNGKTKYETNSTPPDSHTPVKCTVEIIGTGGTIKINITNTGSPSIIYQYEVDSFVFLNQNN
jgi:hypothetical protein